MHLQLVIQSPRNWIRKSRMETFSNNRVTKNNSVAKIRQFSLWARKDTNQIFSLTFLWLLRGFFQFSLTFPGFPWFFSKKQPLFQVFPDYCEPCLCSYHCKKFAIKDFLLTYLPVVSQCLYWKLQIIALNFLLKIPTLPPISLQKLYFFALGFGIT